MHRRSSSPELLELELLDTEVTARAPRRADEVLSVENLSARLGRRVVIRDVDLRRWVRSLNALVGTAERQDDDAARRRITATEQASSTRGEALSGTSPPTFGVRRSRCATASGSEQDAHPRYVLPADAALTLFSGCGASSNAGVLSGGEQRLVAFAIALMGEPRLLLVDEPAVPGPTAVRRVLRAPSP
jgi:ATPase subunit of ABC transporter with duplicated ATPase domains